MVAKINFEFLEFNEFSHLDECPRNGNWKSTRSGGRIEANEDQIFLTVGDFGDMIPNQISQIRKALWKNYFY